VAAQAGLTRDSRLAGPRGAVHEPCVRIRLRVDSPRAEPGLAQALHRAVDPMADLRRAQGQPAVDWIAFQWAFGEPKRVDAVEAEPLQLDPGLQVAAFGPEPDSVWCQLAFWDEARTRWVVCVDFFAPLPRVSDLAMRGETKMGLAAALQSWVAAESRGGGGGGSGAEARPARTDVDSEFAQRWMVRWCVGPRPRADAGLAATRALPAASPLQAPASQDARLAVSSAVASGVAVACVSRRQPRTVVHATVGEAVVRLAHACGRAPPVDLVLVELDRAGAVVDGGQVVVDFRVGLQVLGHVGLRRWAARWAAGA
jgi:hypothetical protein